MNKHYCDWCGKEIEDDKYVNTYHNGLLNFNDEEDICYKCWNKVIKFVKRDN